MQGGPNPADQTFVYTPSVGCTKSGSYDLDDGGLGWLSVAPVNIGDAPGGFPETVTVMVDISGLTAADSPYAGTVTVNANCGYDPVVTVNLIITDPGCASDAECDDGLPCTNDTCDTNGVCQHDVNSDGLCGEAVEADIYVMLDRTGSTTSSSRGDEAAAAKTLLGFFAGVQFPPPIAVGAFGCNGFGFPGGQACTLISLSNNGAAGPYGDDDGATDGDHYHQIDRAMGSTSSVGTHFVAALNAAGAELATGAETGRVLIFVSDGGNTDSAQSTEAAADALKASGVEIFTILFSTGQPGEVANMQAIASDPVEVHFYNAPDSTDLAGILQRIAEEIGCDDGDPCTRDECVGSCCAFTAIPGCADCNTNGIPDECDLSCDNMCGDLYPGQCGLSSDCQPNGVPDECELEGNDCNGNGVPDDCELEGADCNTNGIPDECELE
ncbi:MAG: VWA domain-containing protein, partial [bacterium]|nr:VWA domain-containing protein [bacterium]